MGRQYTRNGRVRVDIWMLAGLHERLIKKSKEYGWTKTRIIEDAVDNWIASRDMEARHGLAEIKQ